MKTADSLFVNLDKWRTLKEMEEYYLRIKNICASDEEYMQMSRIKKGRFKEFLEEFWPLYCFANTKYCEDKVRFKLVIGNQGYDAIIEDKKGNQAKLEISSYLDGKLENENGNKLNETRMGIMRSINNGVHEKYYRSVIENMKNKSTKQYPDIDILFVVDTMHYFEVLDFNPKGFLKSLKEDMRRIEFAANNVYLMVFNDQPLKNISKNTYLISLEIPPPT
jgi:hypothetical protein